MRSKKRSYLDKLTVKKSKYENRRRNAMRDLTELCKEFVKHRAANDSEDEPIGKAIGKKAEARVDDDQCSSPSELEISDDEPDDEP